MLHPIYNERTEIKNLAPRAFHRNGDIGGEEGEDCVADLNDGYLPFVVACSEQMAIIACLFVTDETNGAGVQPFKAERMPGVEQRLTERFALNTVNQRRFRKRLVLCVEGSEDEGIVIGNSENVGTASSCCNILYISKVLLPIEAFDGIVGIMITCYHHVSTVHLDSAGETTFGV